MGRKLGMRLTDETKALMSVAQSERRKKEFENKVEGEVRVSKHSRTIIGDGVEYASLTHAANVTGLRPPSISYRIASSNFPGWKFKEDV